MRELTMGSLFSGLGGFELASIRNGIRPVWNSDIEPYVIAVTRNHFPNTRHVGSVTEISGAELEPVDIITFGSPCQDLSVVGKQAGIHEGARSSLFFQAVRIIKEMREKDIADGRTDQFIRPRFAVWENVPGAFSSNKGKDFQAVLQAFCEIRGGADHIVPLPPKGKWLPAGNIVGNGFSLAWRVLDAAGWGVPQRRKRIFLVADFAGERAGEILFNEDRLHGHSAPGGEAGEGTSADVEGSIGRSNQPICLNFQGNKSGCCTTDDGTSYGLNAMHGHDVHVVVGSVKCLNPWDCESKRQYEVGGVYRTLDAGNGAGGQAHGVCYSPAAFMGGQGAKACSIAYADDGSTPTLKSAPSGGNTVPDVVYPINTMVATRGGKDDGRTTFGVGEANDPQFTLSSAHEHAVCYALDATSSNSMKSRNPHSGFHEETVTKTLNTSPDPTCNQGGNVIVQTAECYAVEGNTVDRESKKNGRGYCEGISPTLNTQDRHAVAYAIEGNGQRESHQGTPSVLYRQTGFAGYSEGVGALKAFGGDVVGGTESIPVQPKVYDARGNGDGKTIPTLTGDHENRITDYTALCVERRVDE